MTSDCFHCQSKYEIQIIVAAEYRLDTPCLCSTQCKLDISRIDICSSNTRAREGRISANGLGSSYTSLPSSLCDVDCLTSGCRAEDKLCGSRFTSRSCRLTTALSNLSGNPTTYGKHSDVDVMGDESPGGFSTRDVTLRRKI